MAKAKPDPETAPQTPLRKPKHGHGALLAGGKPGNKGGGRKPDWLKQWCDDVLADDKSCAQVIAIMRDKNHNAFATMWKAVAERAAGKPAQPVEHSGGITVAVEYGDEDE